MPTEQEREDFSLVHRRALADDLAAEIAQSDALVLIFEARIKAGLDPGADHSSQRRLSVALREQWERCGFLPLLDLPAPLPGISASAGRVRAPLVESVAEAAVQKDRITAYRELINGPGVGEEVARSIVEYLGAHGPCKPRVINAALNLNGDELKALARLGRICPHGVGQGRLYSLPGQAVAAPAPAPAPPPEDSPADPDPAARRQMGLFPGEVEPSAPPAEAQAGEVEPSAPPAEAQAG